MDIFTKMTGSRVMLLVSLLLTGLYFLVMTTGIRSSVGVETIVGVIKPLGVGVMALVVLSLLFLCFPEQVFRRWLRQIVWWYLLITIAIAASISPESSHIMSVDRSAVVLYLMCGLLLISVPFAFYTKRRLS